MTTHKVKMTITYEYDADARSYRLLGVDGYAHPSHAVAAIDGDNALEIMAMGERKDMTLSIVVDGTDVSEFISDSAGFKL